MASLSSAPDEKGEWIRECGLMSHQGIVGQIGMETYVLSLRGARGIEPLTSGSLAHKLQNHSSFSNRMGITE